MKKKLEQDLISLAHKTLKLSGKEDIKLMYQQAKALYETLAVLNFYENNYSLINEPLNQEKFETALEKISPAETSADIIKISEIKFDNINSVLPQELLAEEPELKIEEEDSFTAKSHEATETKKTSSVNDLEATFTTLSEEEPEEILDNQLEEIYTPDNVKEMQVEAEDISEIIETPENISEDNSVKTLDFDSIINDDFKALEFVKVEEPTNENKTAYETKTEILKEETKITITETIETAISASKTIEISENKKASVNDLYNKSLTFGLNDRIAFVKYLFDGSNEDFNRVVSQINTFATYAEAEDFVNNLVKPEYNNWQDKDDYVARFMGLVSKKFEK